MTLHDVTDTALIAELRSAAETAAKELGNWRDRAHSLLAQLEASIDGNGKLQLQLDEALREVEQLRCGDLMAFGDGELEATRADKFRAHLGRCEECQRGLVEHARIDARLSEMAEPRGGGR